MTRIIAVTGATGYVGKFVVAELLREGYHIRGLMRPTSDVSGFAANHTAQLEWVTGDLLDADASTALVTDVDAVVHLAYSHVPGRYRGGEGENLGSWLDINLHGSIRLLLTARDAHVRQFIFLSSRAVFSRTEPGRALDETHPVSPDTHYGAYKAAVENMMTSFANIEGMSTTSVRATGVYGLIWPVEQSKWWGLVQRVLAGDMPDYPPGSKLGGTEVHGADVARTIAALLAQPNHAPPIVHLSDCYVTQRQLVELIYKHANLSGPLPPLPTTPPSNVLVSSELDGLGMTLGGETLLDKTTSELVSAHFRKTDR
ncbi:MAG: NAD(P)-dependent oxidoreductase [Chloroflexota bacterium]